jgi:ribosomal protein L31
MVIEDEINLEMEDSEHVAFNGDGRIAVAVGRYNKFVAFELGRNDTNPE